MNIFCYSSDPAQCAIWLDNARHNKMILETAQLLSTATRVIADIDDNPPVYKRAYYNHPCTKWARAARGNFEWLIEHMQALVDTKPGDHKSARLLPVFRDYATHHNWSDLPDTTPFVNCARNSDLGIDYTHLDDVHLAYRLYHIQRWAIDKPRPRWTWGKEPGWRKQCPSEIG